MKLAKINLLGAAQFFTRLGRAMRPLILMFACLAAAGATQNASAYGVAVTLISGSGIATFLIMDRPNTATAHEDARDSCKRTGSSGSGSRAFTDAQCDNAPIAETLVNQCIGVYEPTIGSQDYVYYAVVNIADHATAQDALNMAFADAFVECTNELTPDQCRDTQTRPILPGVYCDITNCNGDSIIGEEMCQCPAGSTLVSGTLEPDSSSPPRCDCNGDREFLNPSSKTCEECPTGMQPDSTGKACEQIVCTGNTYLNGNSCESCDAGMELNTARSACIPICQGDMMRETGTDNCICSTPGQIADTRTEDENDCAAPATCTGDMQQTANILDCMCPDGQIANTRTEDESDCAAPATCTGGMVQTADMLDCTCANGFSVNEENTACECPEGREEVSGESDGETIIVCAERLPEAESSYTAENCEEANWEAAITINADLVRHSCHIPYRVVTEDAGDTGGAVALAAQIPQQVAAGDTGDFCIIAEHPDFNGGGRTCADVFKQSGFPPQTEAFITALQAGGSPRLEVAEGTGRVLNFLPPAVAGGGSGIGPAGIMIFSLIGAVFLSGSEGLDAEAFSITPQSSFALTENGTRYSYGSRIDYRKDEVSAYWGASQAASGSALDAWYYVSGLHYTGDFWRAGYDGVNFGKDTEIDAQFIAEWRSGIWHWTSGVKANYNLDELGNQDGAAYWNAGLLLDYNHWQIAPSVDLYWRNGESLGENARFRVNIRREF